MFAVRLLGCWATAPDISESRPMYTGASLDAPPSGCGDCGVPPCESLFPVRLLGCWGMGRCASVGPQFPSRVLVMLMSSAIGCRGDPRVWDELGCPVHLTCLAGENPDSRPTKIDIYALREVHGCGCVNDAGCSGSMSRRSRSRASRYATSGALRSPRTELLTCAEFRPL